MSATGVEIRTCPNGKTVFQFLYEGAPDACAGSDLPPTTPKPGFSSLPSLGLIQNLPPWLTGTEAQPDNPDITPAPAETDKEECSCKKGRKDGPQLILLLLTLLWLTA